MDHQALAQLLGNYGEFAGAIAVVVTLIYLSIQVRQSSHLIEQNALAVRAQSKQTEQNAAISRATEQRALVNEFNTHVRSMTDPNVLPAFRQGLVSSLELDKDSQVLVWRTFVEWVNYLERCIYASDAGVFPEAEREAIETWVLQMLITPGGTQYWESYATSHGVDVQNRINERLADSDSLPPAITDVFPFLRV